MTLGAQWRAMQREAQLAAAETAHGVTLLGRANHAQAGLYAQAFFALSIGLERTGKIIFLADHAIENGGSFPRNQDLKDIGHDLGSLLQKCEAIGSTLDPSRRFAERPTSAIHQAIEEVLSLFATDLRYYNLNHLAGADGGQEDPLAMWWRRVAEPICDKHYSKRQRARDETDAAVMEQLLNGHSIVRHSNETGEPIRDVSSLWMRGGATRVVQRYGRFYTLQIMRWLASIICKLSLEGAYGKRIEPLLGLDEPFRIFYNEDTVLRSKKSWSIYPR